jgi:hypothetical protein
MKTLDLSIAFVLGGFFFSPSIWAGLSTSCPGESKSIEVKIESSFQLLTSLTEGALISSSGEAGSFLKESAQQHLRFLKTSLHSQLKKKHILITFDDQEPSLSDFSLTPGSLAWPLEIEAVEHPDVSILQAYILKAQKKKSFKVGAEISFISYKGIFKALVCNPKSAQDLFLNELSAMGPADPWLAHWLSPKKDHKLVQWKKSKYTIPPYFDSEYADIPHPEYAWYFWEADYQGSDAKGKAYSASSFVQAGKELSVAKLTTVAQTRLPQFAEAFSLDSLAPEAELTATVIFGIIDPKLEQLNFTKIIQKKPTGGITEWSEISKLLLDWNQRPNIELGSFYATGFLTNLNRILQMSSIQYSYSKKEQILTIKAKLNSSGRNFRIHFYFGPTDLLAGAPPKHWHAARQGLLNDHIVLYTGHSGLGENFSWKNISEFTAQTAQQKPALSKKIVGIFSCYSFNYFQTDMSQLLAENSLLVTTGSSYTSARGPIGLVDWVDKSLSKMGSKSFALLEPDDFLIFQKVKDRHENL